MPTSLIESGGGADQTCCLGIPSESLRSDIHQKDVKRLFETFISPFDRATELIAKNECHVLVWCITYTNLLSSIPTMAGVS